METVLRVMLIAVVLLNALGPTTALAMPQQLESNKNLLAEAGGNKGTSNRLYSTSSRSLALQKNNALILVGTNTPEASQTPSPDEVTPIATPISTIAPSPTPIPNSAETSSVLAVEFSASPDQLTAGDQVTFTLKITNNGESPLTGIQFLNTVLDGLDDIQSEEDGFIYDAQTRQVVWNEAANETVSPHQSRSIIYTAVIVTDIQNAQITDTVTITADGFPEPVNAGTTLMVGEPNSSTTMVDTQGGEVEGLNGLVTIDVSKDTLDTSAAISIQDVTDEYQDSAVGSSGIVFELNLLGPQPQEEQQDLAPSTNAGDPSPSDDSTPILNDETATGENDEEIALQPVETDFNKPVALTVSLDSIGDLPTLGADITPYLVTLDESSNTWVRMPLKAIDREANTITAELPHFSTWGVGIGPSFPTNSANILLFDSAYPALFSGRSKYSIPLWTPPGRNGMQPDLALSYSSGSVDGVLGDVQAPWVGMGWNIDSVEIARKITNGGCTPCGGGSYGYEDKFVLLFNGSGSELIDDNTTPDRYRTQQDQFLYIQRHNDILGNGSTANATGEWWEVIEKDGTRWRLGWDDTNSHSEQLAAMKGYPGENWTSTYSGWGSLGYAGHATDVVAARWRVDQVTDVYGNTMSFTYHEDQRLVAGTSTNYDRASYIETISYTGHTSGTPAAAYSAVFVRESRGTSDVPTTQTQTEWDNWETDRLDRIDVKYGSTTVRTYDLSYTIDSHTDGGVTWQTTILTSIATTGSNTVGTIVNTSSPTVTFTYTDKDNRAANGGSSNEWAYPRLATISNGWSGISTYTYENDGRPYTSWYNWRVNQLNITDGVNASPMKSAFIYSTPCYNDSTAGRCNGSNVGELIGYAQTTTTNYAFDGTSVVGKVIHEFFTNIYSSSLEYETQYQNASGTTLRKTTTLWVGDTTSGMPPAKFTYFNYPGIVEEYSLDGNSLVLVSYTFNSYDTATGNLVYKTDANVANTNNAYRTTLYEYVTNPDPNVWILNTVSRRTVQDANGVVLSEQQYGYDGNLPGVACTPTPSNPCHNKPDLSRVVNGSQTIDTKYHYDSYGNVDATYKYKTYGTTSNPPTGDFSTYSSTYDDSLKTYAISTDPPLLPATNTTYDYGLGLPITVTDPNGATTTTSYDGLGRVKSVTYQGYPQAQANIKYTYPDPSGSPLSISAPFAVKMELWDETVSVYRSSWQIADGLGRAIQTQSPSETTGTLVLTDTSYDSRGMTLYSGLPRFYTGTGGAYYSPSWGSIPHSTSSYDALGRISSVAYADGTSETTSYSGLRTTFIDKNSHQKVQEKDAFGRMIKVEEYTGTNPYTLYATTQYSYDERDLLKQVTDAESNITIITYDGFGRKIEMTDPDLGNWRYRYDASGNLIAQIDAKRQAINLYYDELNRLKGKTYTTGPVNPDTYQPSSDPGYNGYTVKNYYDEGTNGYGRRTHMEDPRGSTTWTYNALGQVTNGTQNIDNRNYTSNTSYDAFGRPLTQTLANTEGLTYTYNAMGALASLSGTNTYVSLIHYNASGQVTDQLLGSNGSLQQYCYNLNNLRLMGLRVYSGSLQTCAANPTSPHLNLSYSYEYNGNISQIVDSTRNETLNYKYDDLDRLLSGKGSDSRAYTYDPIGNVTSQDNSLPNPGTDGLISWWSMNEINGTRYDNHSLDHLTDANTISSIAGKQGSAAQFVLSKSQSLQIADSPVISMGTGARMTACAWTKLDSKNSSLVQEFLSKGAADGTWEYYLRYDGRYDRFTYVVTSNGSNGTLKQVNANTLGSPVIGQWYFVCGGYDGTNIWISVNAGVRDIVAFTANIFDGSSQLLLGGNSSYASYLNGALDEVILYKRSLSTSEVSWFYNSGLGREYLHLGQPGSPGTTNLVAWWSMDEAGGTRYDSYSTNHLTDTKTIGSATGRQGNAANFLSANSEYLSIPDNTNLSMNGTNFTIAGWVKFASVGANYQVLVGKQGSGSLNEYQIYKDTNNKLVFSVYGNTSGSIAGIITTPESVSAGTWYFFTAEYDGAAVKISLNAGNFNNSSYSSGAVDNINSFRLGANTDGAYLNGSLDEVIIYKRSLSQSEINWLYNNGSGRSYTDLAVSPATTNLVSWWGMSESSGTRNDSYSINHLADNNTVTSTVGKQGTAAQFTAANSEFLSIPDNASISMGSGARMTACAWAKLSSKDASLVQEFLAKGTTDGTWEYYLRYDGRVDRFTYVVTSNGSSGTLKQVYANILGSPAIGQWYFVCSGYDGANIWISVDAGGRDATTFTGDIFDGSAELRIGGTSSFANYLDGSLDEAVIYKRSLAANEINWLYNNGSGHTYVQVSSPPTLTGVTYAYDTAHKHAVTSLSSGESYTYDANGNMTCRAEGSVTYKQDFNIENQLIAVSVMSGGCNGTVTSLTSFVYDGDGNMVMKINSDGSKTIYVGGVYEEDRSSSGTLIHTRVYYPAGGAMRIDGTLYYVLKDQLGSASVVTDSGGNVVGEQRYYPFGETRFTSGTMYTDKLYTGQRDTGLGIYYYNARFYSPYINHFVSADTIVPSYANPQNLNRYSYVTNNPLRYTDPTGHAYCDLINSQNAEDCNAGESRIATSGVVQGHHKQDKDKGKGAPPIVVGTYTPIPTSTSSITNLMSTFPAQCTSSSPCIGNFVPSATPSPSATPYNVLATVGANIDIVANTAVVGGVKYCVGNNEPGCGQTAGKAFPQLEPWVTGFDGAVGTVHAINDSDSSRTPTQLEREITYVAAGLSIPTSVIPLLIFFFAP